MRVLVAEDDDALRDVLARGLQESGYVVDAVADGEAAMAFVTTYEYDVVVLDWRMPRMSGYDALAAIRAKRIAVPVLMLTALDRASDRMTRSRRGRLPGQAVRLRRTACSVAGLAAAAERLSRTGPALRRPQLRPGFATGAHR